MCIRDRFFSPRSPTSLASTAYPALSSAGNLWVWTPQVHVQRRIAVNDATAFSLQAGMLDQLTGELPQEYVRAATAGERSGVPAGALRGGFHRRIDVERAIDAGVSGYFGRQEWVRGEAYHGQAIAGFGGGASPSVVFAGPAATLREPIPVVSSGGWLQLKVTP